MPKLRRASPSRGRLAVAAIVPLLVLAACGSGSGSPTTASTRPATTARGVGPAAMTLPTETVSVPGGSIVVVHVRVAGGPSVPVRLDTGSSGLVVLSSAVGPGVSRTTQSLSASYLAGSVSGVLAHGAVTVGTASTPAGTAFEEVPADQSAFFRQDGVDGILGVGTADGATAATPIFSPFLQLPSPLWRGFTVDVSPTGPGSVVLGPVDAPAGSASLAMQPATPASYPSGVPAFQKDATLCWTVSTEQPVCGLTDLDLGGPAGPTVGTGVLPYLPVTDNALRAGLPVGVATPSGAPLWSFSTAGAPGQSGFVTVEDLPGDYTQFNTGIGFFLANVVAYDVAGGRFLVAPKG